ncbi:MULTISPECIES: HD-GYP domain-containing protein [unclassified Psychrobacillus]|uniref:HD-GYP domain-containing protein n=1 Tax=unclassified Psychrobacillus TaxID=2636677 RepID=UPI0030F56B4B
MKSIKRDRYEQMYRHLLAYDGYTADHSNHVANVATEIAREMNFTEEDVEMIYFAARLHDIGKIYVPLEILNKPGRLTEEEFQIVKGHPLHGYNMLDKNLFPENVRKAVLSHHERVDGKGYPHSLPEEEIDVFSRIISVADVYDALISERPYRPALKRETALNIIKKDTGTHFCPEVVSAFFQVEDELYAQMIS